MHCPPPSVQKGQKVSSNKRPGRNPSMSSTSEVTIYKRVVQQLVPELEEQIDKFVNDTRKSLDFDKNNRKVSTSSDEYLDTSDETGEFNALFIADETVAAKARPNATQLVDNMVREAERSKAQMFEIEGKASNLQNIALIDNDYQMIDAHIRNDLDMAVNHCLRLIRHFQENRGDSDDDEEPVIYTGKTDLSSTFRVLPLKIHCLCWVVFKATNPKDGKTKYFVDKCLPFGASISCSHYQRFSNALKHIMDYRTGAGKDRAITNYLDDFLFMALVQAICNAMIQQFLDLCTELNLPVAAEKTDWVSTLTVFLGILLNGRNLCLAIPIEKQVKALNLLNEITAKKKMTVKQLQVLTGYLNFLTKAIFAGCMFTRCMYSKFANLGKHLKPHHHIRIDAEFRFDCLIWQTFLKHHRDQAVCRPMVDLNKLTSAKDLFFYSDASTNPKLGFGAIYDKHWIYAQWEPNYVLDFKPSIEYLELLALTAALLTWGHLLKDQRIVVFCDNTAVVSMINSTASSCRNCMYLLRLISLNGLIHN